MHRAAILCGGYGLIPCGPGHLRSDGRQTGLPCFPISPTSSMGRMSGPRPTDTHWGATKTNIYKIWYRIILPAWRYCRGSVREYQSSGEPDTILLACGHAYSWKCELLINRSVENEKDILVYCQLSSSSPVPGICPTHRQ